jgi:hypothetical protein
VQESWRCFLVNPSFVECAVTISAICCGKIGDAAKESHSLIPTTCINHYKRLYTYIYHYIRLYTTLAFHILLYTVIYNYIHLYTLIYTHKPKNTTYLQYSPVRTSYLYNGSRIKSSYSTVNSNSANIQDQITLMRS